MADATVPLGESAFAARHKGQEGEALMTGANVISLPTAAAAPVRQGRRRGRLPKAVPSLTRFRLQRRDEAAGARAEAKVPDPDLVAGLTTLLRLAVAGELTGFVMSAHRSGGHDVLSAGSYRADPMLAIAAATRMQQRFCTLVDEEEA